jgi:HD-like signal output (HDOD) protein
MSSRAEPAEAGSRLATLPVVAARLIALYSSEDYTVDQVVSLLEADPGISSRVVRLANSAYYGFQGKVESSRRAALLLGGATVQAVALGTTLLHHWAAGSVPPQIEALWIEAFLCGTGCRYLARRLTRYSHRGDPDALFLAGLLRDVGKLLFLAEDPGGYAAMLLDAGSGTELRVAERQHFGRDHAEVGGEFLDAWRFPRRTAALVRHHHDGGLRAELHPDWEILAAASAALKGEAAAGDIPPDLVADLADHLARSRAEAEAFYRSLS